MAKIIIEKDEAVADLIERILEVEDAEITLVVPKRSHLLDSANNFRLIAREGNVLQKEIMVESVDEKALLLAKEAGLRVTHPLFDENMRSEERAPAFSDILPAALRHKAPAKLQKPVPLKVERDEEDFSEGEPEDEALAHGEAVTGGEYERGHDAAMAGAEEREPEEERYDTLSDYTERPRHRKWIAVGIAILALFFLGAWGVSAAFGKAEIIVRFKGAPWRFEETVTALTSVKDIDATRGVIPGQFFEEKKSLVQTVPASGRATVSDKARATLTIVNAFGTDPQTLVATTRFETPDGKIFRLDNQAIVPAASSENGKLVPASIKVPVTADKAGPAYNVGKIDKLTIPGFKGSPKFDGFYGMLPDGASGGFIGERAVASEADVANAKTKVNDLMKAAFQTTFLSGIPSDIKILEEAGVYELGAISEGRASGEGVAVTAEATFRVFGFREKDIAALLGARAKAGSPAMHLEDLSLTYAKAAPDFGKKQLTFVLAAEGSLVPDFNKDEFAKTLFGASEAEARSAIMALPEFAGAEVKLWPAWLRRIPANPEQVVVTVE